MMIIRTVKAGALVLALALSTSPTHAEEAANTDYLASIGGPIAVNGHTINANSGDGVQLETLARRSYSCEGVPSASDSEFAFSTTVSVVSGDAEEALSARATGEMTPIITAGEGTEGKARISFIPPAKGRYRVAIESAKDGGEPVRVVCKETTLFGGFNTFVNNFNFVELVNLSNEEIHGYISAYSFNGNEVIAQQPFTVRRGRRIDLDLHTAAGERNFGIIKVVHDGPYNALRGRVSFYTGTPRLFVFRGAHVLQPALN